MWVPKDERRLLQGYLVKIGEVDTQCDFFYDDLLGFIKSNESSRNEPSADDPHDTEGFAVWRKDCNRIVIANKALKKRGLITSSAEGFEPSQAITISLTLTGCDLGRKYCNKWLWIKLWYDEYIKNHPILLIVGYIISYIAGIISVLLVSWLSKILGAK